jgi:hypothetical protein
MTQTVLILGARGKIGRHFAHAFEQAGWKVRRYTRGTDMAAAARGCDVIVNGLNPPNYHNWATLLPAITTEVLAAAKASGATILFPGNVYVFGTQPGPWDETTPHKPVARKGGIRSEVEARYRAAAAEGVRTIVLRAGDFIDPDSGDTLMDIAYLRRFAKGVVTAMGDPDAAHAYAYLPDMAGAGVMLAEKRSELPAFCEVPFPGHTFSIRELTRELERLTGRRLRVASFPWWAFRLAAPVWELGRELGEMRYLYDTPHSLSGDRLRALLPDFRGTPLSEVLQAVLARREGFAAAA